MSDTTCVAWKVTFRRNRFVPTYRREEVIVVSADESLAELLGALRSLHPDALMDFAERLGGAVVA